MNRLVQSVVVIAALVVGGPTAAIADSKSPGGIEQYTRQTLTWTPCNVRFECTQVIAPLDWGSLNGARIHLALIRQSATSGHARGSLLVNPGGPGGSGYTFIRDSVDFAVSATLQRSFDVVGFDPRGVGRSSAVDCYDDGNMRAYLNTVPPGTRGSAEWIRSVTADARAFANACKKNTGALLQFVDTVSAARDLDLLRAVLGDAKLNYLGYSYGTYLGATYAELFPTRVGRLVLDGAVDPALGVNDVSLNQAVGFEDALRDYLRDCLASAGCPFAPETLTQALTDVRRLLNAADAGSYFGSDGRELGGDLLFTAIAGPLYAKAAWPNLTTVFRSLLAGDADPALAQADRYNDVSPESNSSEAFRAIGCLDYPVQTNASALAAQRARLDRAAPVLGTFFAYSEIGCGVWPYQAKRTPAPIHASGSPLIVVIGTTHDPATPYSQAVSLARELSQGRLITFDGDGHTAYAQSTCVQQLVDAFLVRGTAPKVGSRC